MNNLLITCFFIFFSIQSFSQNHIPPCNGSADHSTGICYGYAIGRAAGRIAGDSDCEQLTFHRNQIDQNYFTYYADPLLNGLQVGDIVKFQYDHVAYVSAVNSPMVKLGLTNIW